MPVFAQTRVPVWILLDYLKVPNGLDSFLEAYPHISREQVCAVLDQLVMENRGAMNKSSDLVDPSAYGSNHNRLPLGPTLHVKPSSTLKPCPFDGGTRLVIERTPRFPGEPGPNEDDFYAYNVHCTTCACEGPWRKSQGGAEQLWNGIPGTLRGGPLPGTTDTHVVEDIVYNALQDRLANSEYLLHQQGSEILLDCGVDGPKWVVTVKRVHSSESCSAKIWHGPGHQSHTNCERTGEHDVHDCHYGEFNQHATWRGSEVFSGVFDETPPEESES